MMRSALNGDDRDAAAAAVRLLRATVTVGDASGDEDAGEAKEEEESGDDDKVVEVLWV